MKEIRCPIAWHTRVAFLGFVEADGIKLGVTIMGMMGEWQVLVLETSGENITEVANEHAYEYLGEFKDFEKARRAGTLYAKKWLEKKLRAKKKCACGPIRKRRR